MNDRELLEFAAKAAGIECTMQSGFEWNPLTDDGDALRLAVKLNMHLLIDFDIPERMGVRVYVDGADAKEISSEHIEATRRAIVRVAAEIGREMK